MKIAFIPPHSLLHYTERTNYQLYLPHLIKDINYFNTYLKYCSREEQFVILDNGAAEDETLTSLDLVALAMRMRPDEVVIPDVIGDMRATIAAAEAFWFDVIPAKEFTPLPFSLMFVAQGQTFLEVMKSANWACQQDWISTIGIPRHLVTTLGDPLARVRVANVIQGHNYSKQIHFLGGNPEFPTEVEFLSDPKVTNQRNVRGMDTSMPFNYAYMGEYVYEESVSVIKRPEGYFSLPDKAFNSEALTLNVEYFLQHHEQGVEA